MFYGDQSRKKMLVEYGFRLPSALDNRPLNFDEFEQRMGQRVFVSATPGPTSCPKRAACHRAGHSPDRLDGSADRSQPRDEGQIDDLLGEIRGACRAERARARDHAHQEDGRRPDAVLTRSSACRCATCTPTSRPWSASRSCATCGAATSTCWSGINLLREGLDLPEVSLVAILDADKEGFLRSRGSLIQTIGRAARNVNGVVIMYADSVTRSMQRCLDGARTRRAGRSVPDIEHGITPTSIVKAIDEVLCERVRARLSERSRPRRPGCRIGRLPERDALLADLQRQMKAAAANLDFEQAARLRDRIREVRVADLGLRRRAARSRGLMDILIRWLKDALLEVQEYVRLL